MLVLSLIALVGASNAAQSANCPRGQIYRVSKHVCVDRDDAVKLGIAHGTARNAAKPEAAPPAEAAPQVADEPAPAPEAAPPQEIAAPSPAPVKVKTVRTIKLTPKPGPEPASPATVEPAPPQPAARTATGLRPSGTAATAPVEAKAESAKTSPFGVLDPGGVPMSQAR